MKLSIFKNGSFGPHSPEYIFILSFLIHPYHGNLLVRKYRILVVFHDCKPELLIGPVSGTNINMSDILYFPKFAISSY